MSENELKELEEILGVDLNSDADFDKLTEIFSDVLDALKLPVIDEEL